jgi:type IV pilus assembly protein PilV
MTFPSLSSRRSMRSPERGFSLIEVLIAVLVMALGMLGMAALQAASLRNNLSAYQRSQATIQAYTIVDSMRANRRLIANYVNEEFLCEPPEDDNTLATDDLIAWIDSLQASLGNQACGKVDCTFPDSGNNNDPFLCVVEVRWDDSRGAGETADLDEFTLRTRVLL